MDLFNDWKKSKENRVQADLCRITWCLISLMFSEFGREMFAAVRFVVVPGQPWLRESTFWSTSSAISRSFLEESYCDNIIEIKDRESLCRDVVC